VVSNRAADSPRLDKFSSEIKNINIISPGSSPKKATAKPTAETLTGVKLKKAKLVDELPLEP